MEQPEVNRSMLIVEDDEVYRSRLAQAFRERGFVVREAVNGQDALEATREGIPGYIVVDLRLQGGFGLDVVRQMRALDASVRIVVVTGYGSIATALEALRLGATHYLTKPADPDDILDAFARADRPPGETSDMELDVPSLARVEWEHLNRVLADSGGNISEAARRLGLHRRSLQRKLAKYPTRR